MDKYSGAIDYIKKLIVEKALDSAREPSLGWIKSNKGAAFTKKLVKSGLMSLAKEYKYPLIGAGVAGTGIVTGTMLSVARSQRNRKDIADLKKKLRMRATQDVGVKDVASTMARMAIGGPVAEGVGKAILTATRHTR